MTHALGMSQIITSRLSSALSSSSLATLGRCQSVRAIFAQFQYFAPALRVSWCSPAVLQAAAGTQAGGKLEDEAALKLLDDAVCDCHVVQ